MEFLSQDLHAAAQAAPGSRETPAPEYGSRCYRIAGSEVTIVLHDEGNGWSSLVTVLPRSGDEAQVIAFWSRIMDGYEKTIIAELDEDYNEDDQDDKTE